MNKSPTSSIASTPAVPVPTDAALETRAALRQAFTAFRQQPGADAQVHEWLARAHPSLTGLTTRP